MLTDQDIEKLKTVFATKDDLNNMEKRQDAKLDEKLDKKFKKELKPIKDHLKAIDGKIDTITRILHHDDRRITKLEKRTSHVEEYLDLPPLEN